MLCCRVSPYLKRFNMLCHSQSLKKRVLLSTTEPTECHNMDYDVKKTGGNTTSVNYILVFLRFILAVWFNLYCFVGFQFHMFLLLPVRFISRKYYYHLEGFLGHCGLVLLNSFFWSYGFTGEFFLLLVIKVS